MNRRGMGAWIVGLALTGAATDFAAAQLAFPGGTEDFESLAIGESVGSLGWPIVNLSDPEDNFTIVAANDVLGIVGPRNGSTQWIRVTDIDAGDVQNRFYSNAISSPATLDYRWTWFVNLESTPPGDGASKPRLTIQHVSGGFSNAWGIEFTDAGANLVVTGVGGPAASVPLYSLASPTGIGDWVRLDLTVRFDENRVSASANGGPSVSLPIDLDGDPTQFRFCYRGEGAGNVVTMLIDDVSVSVGATVPATGTWAMVVFGLILLTGMTIVFGRRSNVPTTVG